MNCLNAIAVVRLNLHLAVLLLVAVALLHAAAAIDCARAQAVDLDKQVAQVIKDCQSGTPLWDCDCRGAKFRAIKSADPSKPNNNIVFGLKDECLDEKVVAGFVMSQCTGTMAPFQKLQGKSLDCTCMADAAAKKIVANKVTTYSGITSVQIEALSKCLSN